MFIDSDVYIIEFFAHKDPRFETNKRFFEKVESGIKYTSIFNILEICGVGIFSAEKKKIERLFRTLHEREDMEILYPKDNPVSVETFITNFITQVFERILRKIHFSDALIINIAEKYSISPFITWNKKHFEGKTELKVVTPAEFLA